MQQFTSFQKIIKSKQYFECPQPVQYIFKSFWQMIRYNNIKLKQHQDILQQKFQSHTTNRKSGQIPFQDEFKQEKKQKLFNQRDILAQFHKIDKQLKEQIQTRKKQVKKIKNELKKILKNSQNQILNQADILKRPLGNLKHSQSDQQFLRQYSTSATKRNKQEYLNFFRYDILTQLDQIKTKIQSKMESSIFNQFKIKYNKDIITKINIDDAKKIISSFQEEIFQKIDKLSKQKKQITQKFQKTIDNQISSQLTQIICQKQFSKSQYSIFSKNIDKITSEVNVLYNFIQKYVTSNDNNLNLRQFIHTIQRDNAKYSFRYVSCKVKNNFVQWNQMIENVIRQNNKNNTKPDIQLDQGIYFIRFYISSKKKFKATVYLNTQSINKTKDSQIINNQNIYTFGNCINLWIKQYHKLRVKIQDGQKVEGRLWIQKLE